MRRRGAKPVIFVILFLLVASFWLRAAEAAIQHDSSTTQTGVSVTSLTWSHTVANQSHRVLIVGVQSELSSMTNVQPTGVTFNGTALTQIDSTWAVSPTASQCVSLWYLLAPAAGTANIVVTWSSTVDQATAGAISLYGVAQSAPEASATSFNNAGVTTTNITTLTNNAWVVDMFGSGQPQGDLAPGSGQTQRFINDSGATTSGGGSTKPVATAGATSVTWSQTGTNRSAQAAASFAPSLGAPRTTSLNATKDTDIKAKSSGNNYGASTSLDIDREAGDLQRALFQFDLSSIPSCAIISSATLKLECTSIGGSLNINVYQLQEAWSEGTGDGTAGEANWNQRMTGTNWTNAGGTYNSTAVATLNTSSTGQHTWDITTLVQDWFSGTKSNYGVLVGSPDGGGNRMATYSSREGSTVPILQVNYTIPQYTWDGGGGTNNWGDANNWSDNKVPTSCEDVSLTGANTIDINVAAACRNITTNNASLTLTVKSSQSLTVGEDLTMSNGTLKTEASFPTVTGATTLSGGTVSYSASSGSQTVAALTYYNLTIEGGGTKTPAANTSIAGDLTVSAGTLDLSSYTANRASSGGTITVSNGATLKIGGTNGFPSNYSTHTLGSTSTVEYAGTTQTVGALTYGNLTINQTAHTGAILAGDTTVNGTLSITSGWLTQGNAYNLTAGTISISAGATLHNQGTGDLTVGAGGVSNSGIIDFKSSGGSCGVADSIQILSSQGGTQRSWTGSGAFRMADLYVQDQGGSASIHCYSCTAGTGNGGNWNIDGGCSGYTTVITLASFSARQDGGHVELDWVTKTEIDNLGFNVYRSTNYGPYTQLNQKLIPGLLSSINGRAYTYDDTAATPGVPVCYLLEDIDLTGRTTTHGPACVFWLATGTDSHQPSAISTTDTALGTQDSARSREQEAGSSGASLDTRSRSILEGHSSLGTRIVTAVNLRSLTARTDGTGVLITWKTGREVNNLGFHVYRDDGGRRTRLTKEPLAGAALKTGGMHLAAGHSYSFVDPGSRVTGHASRYYLEDLDLDGTRTLHGPVTPTLTAEPLIRKQYPFLSQLFGEQGAADRALKARLGARRAPQGLFGQPFPYGFMSPVETQRALAASQAIKLFIRDEGWYRVSLPELAAAGLTVGAPRFLQLYVDGKEEPLLVRDGAIEFYGRGIDSPYTDTKVYWLVMGTRPGERIQKVIARGFGTQTSFPSTVTLKERTIYFAALQNGDQENFFGSVITTVPVEKQLTLTHKTNGDGLLDVSLQGVTVESHAVTVALNGQVLGSIAFSGQEKGKGSFRIPAKGLTDGANTVRFIGSGDLDVSLIDTIKLTYPRTYTVDQDRLQFTARGGSEVTLRGFSTNKVRVMDTTDPAAVQEVTGEVKDGTLKITIPGTGTRTLIAVTGQASLAPAAIVPNEPSAWYRYTGADLLIVSHRDFMGSLAPLQTLREQEGLRVALVDIENIYDEFSFGMKTPYALKAFMTQAHFWRRPPRYVLLVGDASFDPKNYLALGSFDFVPTKLVDATYLETASDDWFVDATNDLLPDIPIGRLPVRTPDEAALVVAKLTGYAKTQQGSTALLVADLATDDDVFDYPAASDAVGALLPQGITTHTFSRGSVDDGTLKASFITGLNQGPLFVNYVGHGSEELWRGDILTTTDADTLMNGNKLPFVVAMTCLNGLFQDVYDESLAEALLLAPRGGAVAVFASTGLTQPDAQAPLNRALVQLLFQGEHLAIGQAVLKAKQATTDPDVRKTWVLIGDPATRLKQ